MTKQETGTSYFKRIKIKVPSSLKEFDKLAKGVTVKGELKRAGVTFKTYPSVISGVSRPLSETRINWFNNQSPAVRRKIRQLWEQFERSNRPATKANKKFWDFARKRGLI